MQTRTASAQERILGGLSLPVIRDVVGVRSWYPLQDGDEIDPEQQSQSLVLRWALHHMLQPRSCIFVDVPRIHELVAAFLGLFVGFHYTQLSPLEHLSFTQLTWLRRFEQHHAARRLSSSQRRAEHFAYISKLEEHGDLEEDDGSVDIEGHDVQDGLGEQDGSSASWTAKPHQGDADQSHGFLLVIRRSPSSAAGIEHSCPRSCGSAAQLDSCGCRAGSWRSKALPGVSFWRRGVSHASSVFGRCCFHVLFWLAVSWFRGTAPLWPQVTQRWARMTRTRRSLRRCRKRWTLLVDLGARGLGPAEYALELVRKHTLNKQQVLAMAPVVNAMQEMYDKRTDFSSCLADGASSEKCNCLWLGAGGSGKTWAYTKVLRPLFQRFFGRTGYIVGAPTHAAVRLLGPEAKTLHKWANVSPNTGLDRRNLRGAKAKGSAVEAQIAQASATVMDELSMNPPDVYHAAGYRFSLLRQEPLGLDMSKYMEEWFGKMPIGIQLADFLQLRPATQKSLCEWVSAKAATEPSADPDADAEHDDLEEAPRAWRRL